MARKKKEKVIHHMGMTMPAEEHEQWHKENRKMTPKEHKKLMKKMGISAEEDKKWHKEQKTHAVDSDARPLNPFAIGGGFLAYCVKKNWLIREGKGPKAKYYSTEKGRLELAKFDIKI
jgi:hypothetical protein